MLLHRCALCGREYLPAGIHVAWHKNIGPIPKAELAKFCKCKPPHVTRSEAVMPIDYVILQKAIIEVGKGEV